MKLKNVLPCIVCGKELRHIFENHVAINRDETVLNELTLAGVGSTDMPFMNQAMDANSFTTTGQYGSTVFDPMDGSELEVNICDDCIKKATEKGQVAYRKIHRPEELVLWKKDE